MSQRYQAGIILPGYNALKVPNAPTIGTATAGASQVSVAFTAPACVGGGAISSYTAFANCGIYRTTGASSPLVVTGLTNGTAYTFKVIATNAFGPSYPSASSNTATPIAQGQQAYVTAGTYSWVAPACVTSVSVVAVGGGGRGGYGGGSGGGALGYKNNYSVTAGSSYTVVVGAGGAQACGCGTSAPGNQSYFVCTGVLRAGGGAGTCLPAATFTGDGGGNGSIGAGGSSAGGAGGYSGAGGNGGCCVNGGSGAGGGGGGGSTTAVGCYTNYGSGGGVGILGQGASGAGGILNTTQAFGKGGSGGTNGALGGPSLTAPGGLYGGGGGFSRFAGGPIRGAGGVGAVRIIWPGATRSFPSTNTGDL